MKTRSARQTDVKLETAGLSTSRSGGRISGAIVMYADARHYAFISVAVLIHCKECVEGGSCQVHREGPADGTSSHVAKHGPN